MMPYIIILKVRKFHQPTTGRFSTARQKPVRGGGEDTLCPLLSRVNKTVSTTQIEKESHARKGKSLVAFNAKKYIYIYCIPIQICIEFSDLIG